MRGSDGEYKNWMIQVPIIDDTVEDDGETFTLTLSDPKGVTIGDGVATGTIRNSEEPVEVSVADAEATEGEDRWMRFRLSLNHIAKDVSGGLRHRGRDSHCGRGLRGHAAARWSFGKGPSIRKSPCRS